VGITADAGFGYAVPEVLATQHDIYLVDLSASLYHTSTDPATKYWTITASRVAAGSAAVSLATVNTQNNTSANWVLEKTSINTRIDLSATTIDVIQFTAARVSTPTDMYGTAQMSYRLAHT
jgi:hypothetical protein